MKNCEHINKAYSQYEISSNVSTTINWICKDCGFEGQESRSNLDEYQATKVRFSKNNTSNL